MRPCPTNPRHPTTMPSPYMHRWLPGYVCMGTGVQSSPVRGHPLRNVLRTNILICPSSCFGGGVGFLAALLPFLWGGEIRGDHQRGLVGLESWGGNGVRKEALCLQWDHSLMGTTLRGGIWACPAGNCPLSVLPTLKPGRLLVHCPVCVLGRRWGLALPPGVSLQTGASPPPGSPRLQLVGGMGHPGQRQLQPLCSFTPL